MESKNENTGQEKDSRTEGGDKLASRRKRGKFGSEVPKASDSERNKKENLSQSSLSGALS